jgi:DNA mismatch repair protein MutS
VEHKHQIVFLHSIKEGPASQSYGLQVAALAGVPEPVIKTAKRYLVKLEQESIGTHSVAGKLQRDLFVNELAMIQGLGESPKMPESELEHPVLAMLRKIVPDDLSPKQALEELYVLKQAAGKE